MKSENSTERLEQSYHTTYPNSTRAIAWRWFLAGFAIAILVLAVPLSRRLELDRTIDQMFAPDDPTLVAYNELRDAFGGNAAVMLVYRDPELMSPAGLERAAAIASRVGQVPAVRGVLTVAQLNELLGVIRPGGILTGLSADTPPLLREEDLIATAFLRLFAGYTHSESGDRSAVVVLLDPAEVTQGYGDVVSALREIAEELPAGASEPLLVGEPVLLTEGFDLIQRDGNKLAYLTLALLSPLVLLVLRRVRWLVLQGLVIWWAVEVTRAAMYLSGMRLSLVSTILTAICTVIAVTAVIHLGVQWRRRIDRDHQFHFAAVRTFACVMPPIFWACMTDAAGFFSLIISTIVPIREFAIMMAIASISVWLAIILFAPLVMSLTINDRLTLLDSLLTRSEVGIRKIAVKLAMCVTSWRYLVIGTALVLACVTVIGFERLRIETSFLANFRDDSDIAQAYQSVERSLQGVGVWDVVLDAPDELTEDYLEQVRALESRLRDLDVQGEKLTKVLSMADADRIAAAIPLLKLASPTMRLGGMRAAVPAFSDALLVPDGATERKLRIMIRSREHLAAETKIALIEAVERVVQETTTSEAWRATFPEDSNQRSEAGRVTGYYVMIARLVSQILGDQWRCLAWAAALVWCLLIVATRSLGLATLALIPNLLPVLGVLGALGWTGYEMNMGAAMIAAVSVGLSIDGSIHFLTAYQRKLRRGRSRQHAVLYAQAGIGLPVVLATVALVIGFVGLGRSEFIPTATFGTLTAVALLLGTAVNLTVLPALLSLPSWGRKPTG